MTQSPANPQGRVDLNAPPPSPPSAAPSKSLVDVQRGQTDGAAAPSSPFTMAIEGMAKMEQGIRLISSGLPALAPAMQELLVNLQQVVPNALADSQAGGAGAVGGGAVASAPSLPAGPSVLGQ